MHEVTVQPIRGFHGKWAFLSNFYPSLIYHTDGLIYSTVEHAFQAQKAPMELRLRFTTCRTPGQVKRLGRSVELPWNWDDIKLDVMHAILKMKFALDVPCNVHLVNLLLCTGDAYLEETNTWGDRFWGVCKGEGYNHLGRLLMEIRSTIREQLLEGAKKDGY